MFDDVFAFDVPRQSPQYVDTQPVRIKCLALRDRLDRESGAIFRENQRRVRAYFGDGRSDDFGDGPALLGETQIELKRRVLANVVRSNEVNARLNRKCIVPFSADDAPLLF